MHVSKSRHLSSSNFAAVFRTAVSSQGSLVVILLLGLFGYFQILPNILSVALLAIISFLELYRKVDKGLPLLELANLIAILQWTVGPALSYLLELDHSRYRMYVSESVYFAFALPATCIFSASMLGFGLFAKQKDILSKISRDFFFNYGIYLFVIAIAAEFASGRAPASVQFFFHLLSQLRYVAAIYFLLSQNKYALICAAVSSSSLFINSSSSGMFHDLLLWLSLIFCMWFPNAKSLHYRKALIFTVAMLSVFAIQVIKQDYRERLRNGEKPNLVLMAITYLSPAGKAWEKDVLSLAIVRLNQGWIISAVLDNVPSREPYAEGQTIKDAVVALVPRFIFPDKVIAGGRDNFRKYTGLPIGNSTSMSICVLGEAYANFGVIGGIVFMSLFGACFAFYYSRILKWTVSHPDFLLWIPLIFYQAVKAETDLAIIANQIVKGSIVAFAGYWAMHRFLPPAQFTKTPSTSPNLLFKVQKQP